MLGYKRLILLIFIMACVSVVVGAIAIGSLYSAALGEERARLADTARSQARLMESIARFNQHHRTESPAGAVAATLQQIEDAHRQYTGFGETGGFAFARREGDNIIFLHSHRAGLERPKPVPFESQRAEPMRRALRGQRGTMVGPDYRGREVLAAYEPVAELDMGIVAKIDLAEVRAPFVRAASVAAGGGLLVVFLGSICFYRLSEPMVRQIRENKELLQTIYDAEPECVKLINPDGGIEMINRAGLRMIEADSFDEVKGCCVHDLAAPEDQETFRTATKRAFGGKSEVLEFDIVGRKGTRRTLETHVVPVRNAENEVVSILGISRDVTKRKEAEEALRREQELTESIIDTARNIVLVLDTEGRIIRFNPYLEELTGWRLEEILGRDWLNTFLPDHARQHVREKFSRAIRGERTHGNVNVILTKDGHERDIEWYDAPLTNDEGGLIGLLCTGLDVTDRRMLEREILEIAAEEQRRIGQELHDSTQQQLTGLGLVVQNVVRALAKLGNDSEHAQALRQAGLLDRIEELRERVQQVHIGLEQTAREVNQLSRGLVPVELDAQGLMSSLTELARGVSDVQDVQCTFVSTSAIKVADNSTATHLYRIAQEAVNNSLKHSHGDRIDVCLSELNNLITLKVLDNGVGIDDKRADGPGMGLRIMAYRADLIGATLGISQPHGGGTEVVCTVAQG